MKRNIAVCSLLLLSLAAIVICSQSTAPNGVMTDLIVTQPALPL